MKKKIIQLTQKSIGFYFNALAYVNPKLLAKKGFQLFCNPMSKQLEKHQIEFLETGKNSVILFKKDKIQTYKWGNGSKKVLMVHGWASHTFRWKSYIENLIENDFTVYAFDAPAHGLSSGKILHLELYTEIIDLMIRSNKEIETIISHSIGGFATTYWLYKNKNQNIKKTVIMGAPGEAKDFFDFYKSILGLSNKAKNIIIKAFAKTLENEPSYFSTSKFAKEIETDCLIIHDKGDKDTNPEYSIRLNENWRNSQLILTEGLGHKLKSKSLEKKVIAFITN